MLTQAKKPFCSVADPDPFSGMGKKSGIRIYSFWSPPTSDPSPPPRTALFPLRPALRPTPDPFTLRLLPVLPFPLRSITPSHKVLNYIEHHSVCPFVGIGTPPPL